MSAGKGDTPRPLSVDRATFAANFERTFLQRVRDNLHSGRCEDCGHPCDAHRPRGGYCLETCRICIEFNAR